MGPKKRGGSKPRNKRKSKSKRKKKQKSINKKIQKNENQNLLTSVPIISASDIERYGYCPLSWWIKFKGVSVSNEKLEKGTDKHKELIKKVSSIRDKEKYSKVSEFNIKLFAFIAIMLAVNAVAIILPLPLIRNFLIIIAILWIIIALIYFIYSLLNIKYFKDRLPFKTIQSSIKPEKMTKQLKTHSDNHLSLSSFSPRVWKRAAIWFLIIGGGLAFNGVAFLQPADPEIMSRIFMISALLWLIGTSAILFIILRREETRRIKSPVLPKIQKKEFKYTLTESEKLVIGFAIVATLLALNGLTIQHRERLAEFTTIGQIIMFLAALWLGISFAFLYLSFRSRLETSRITRDIKQAPTELTQYQIVVEKIKSLSLPERIFSFNWPIFFTVVAVILGINSILIRYGTVILGKYSELLSRFLVVIALLWLFGAFIFLYNVVKNTELAEEIRRLHGIYKGKIEYTDKLDDKSKMLFSRNYRIRGKPDYIVKLKGKYIPVEIKTGKIPRGPHFSHILQIAAYCLLIEEKYKTPPPYGIISYSKKDKHKIYYDSKLKELIVEKLNEMHKCIDDDVAHRNHRRAGKCRYCSRRNECPEKLE